VKPRVLCSFVREYHLKPSDKGKHIVASDLGRVLTSHSRGLWSTMLLVWSRCYLMTEWEPWSSCSDSISCYRHDIFLISGSICYNHHITLSTDNRHVINSDHCVVINCSPSNCSSYKTVVNPKLVLCSLL
jgi:hypothetical protein